MQILHEGGRGLSSPQGRRLAEIEASRISDMANTAARWLLWPLGALIACNVVAGIVAHAFLL